jgi:hypothetical protein
MPGLISLMRLSERIKVRKFTHSNPPSIIEMLFILKLRCTSRLQKSSEQALSVGRFSFLTSI